jgi:hypothetical protein
LCTILLHAPHRPKRKRGPKACLQPALVQERGQAARVNARASTLQYCQGQKLLNSAAGSSTQ